MKNVLHRLASHARMAVTRGRVLKADLKPKRTVVQVSGLYNEVLNNIELFLPYGMSALPVSGEDLILLQNGNSRSHLIALFADASALRISDLQAGEFGFRDKNGQQVVFRHDRLEITTPLKVVANITGDLDATVGGQVNLTATGKVVGSASEWDLTGDVKVTGKITSTGDIKSTGGNVSDQVRSMADDRGKYDGHKHTGVTTGSGTSGPPDTLE